MCGGVAACGFLERGVGRLSVGGGPAFLCFVYVGVLSFSICVCARLLLLFRVCFGAGFFVWLSWLPGSYSGFFGGRVCCEAYRLVLLYTLGVGCA